MKWLNDEHCDTEQHAGRVAGCASAFPVQRESKRGGQTSDQAIAKRVDDR